VILLLLVGVLGAPSCGLNAKKRTQAQAASTALPPRIETQTESAPASLAPAGTAHRENKSSYIWQINSIIGSHWVYAVRKSGAPRKPETAEYNVVLNAQGRLVSLRLTSEGTTPAYAAICERAITKEAKVLPPVPPELLDAKSKTFQTPLTFQLYDSPRF
jgi:hypothetical protein